MARHVPADGHALNAYISETVDPISIRSSQGDRSIQATLITVELGSSGGSPWQVARAAWRVSKLAARLQIRNDSAQGLFEEHFTGVAWRPGAPRSAPWASNVIFNLCNKAHQAKIELRRSYKRALIFDGGRFHDTWNHTIEKCRFNGIIGMAGYCFLAGTGSRSCYGTH